MRISILDIRIDLGLLREEEEKWLIYISYILFIKQKKFYFSNKYFFEYYY